jgi:hypothetical protein
MIFMDLLDRLLSGKKVMTSKRRNTAVIERVWINIRVNLLVTSMFVGWVAVGTVLVFMCERAVYGGLYVASHLVAILSNCVVFFWKNLPLPLSVSRLWGLIQLRCKIIPRLGRETFSSNLHRLRGIIGMILQPACWACIAWC